MKIIKLAFMLFLIMNTILINIKFAKCSEEEIETICDREGQTICQAMCTPVSFKKCKKNFTVENYNICCTCEFFEGLFHYECINIGELES